MPYKRATYHGEPIPLKSEYNMITEDGRYGLIKSETGDGGTLWYMSGVNSYIAGEVWDAENIEAAAINADMEMDAMIADLREEFGS